MTVGVVEVVGCVTESVDFQLGENVLGKFLKQPVDNQAALDSTLRVEDEDDFGVLRIVELFFDDAVADSDVFSGI